MKKVHKRRKFIKTEFIKAEVDCEIEKQKDKSYHNGKVFSFDLVFQDVSDERGARHGVQMMGSLRQGRYSVAVPLHILN